MGILFGFLTIAINTKIEINILETKVKQRRNKGMVFLEYQMKQNNFKEENKNMAKSKLVKANEKIAESVVGGYKKIEEGVVGGYKKIEDGAVGGFHKIADRFVDNFLTKEGESVEEARERLAAEQKAREEVRKAKLEEHSARQERKNAERSSRGKKKGRS